MAVPVRRFTFAAKASPLLATPQRTQLTLPTLSRWQSTAKRNLQYQQDADRLLARLAEVFERLKDDGTEWIEAVDFDAGDGVLQIDFTDSTGNEASLLMNKHYVTTQIWYSCPKSGANYFDFNPDRPWVSARTKLNIVDQIAEDIEAMTEHTVDLSSLRNEV